MALADFCRILWRERELLELLLFKLEEEQLVLASGRSRWLAHATREVEAVLEQIRRSEQVRSLETDVVALELGLPVGPSLAAIARVAPEPYSAMLLAHRDSFLALTAEITELAQANRRLLHEGMVSLSEALAAVEEPVGTYGPGASRSVPRQGAGRLVDEAL
ncbi:flagellar export chaperone FlgN [Aquipuribacter nitratireducens]|uniref:Flagellar export chaperone FlgN n=1 Tax=Aquipuribacter nitratireducens TaxID=650104 RepID=A0ABW0GNE0_9MICO